MAWSNLPLGNADLQDYSFFSQIWRATKERARAFSNAIWPRGNFIWSSGVITSATDNLDGSYTFGHATDNSDSIALNRWGGYPGHPPTPANYDLIFDHDDETQVVHVHIYGSTSTTITVDSTTDHIIADLATGGFLYPSLTVSALIAALALDPVTLVGRKYYIIQRGGEWWHERWIQWPNDQEKWVGLGLTAGAKQSVSSLASAGTTATAVVTAHQFVTTDTVVIAGAPAPYAPTGTITVVDANTFNYPIASSTTSPATGTITATCTLVGAYDSTATYSPGLYATGCSLMVAGSDTLLKRITLTGNDANNLLFTRLGGTISVSSQYAIMAANNTLGHPSKFRFYNFINTLCSYNDMKEGSNPFSGPPFLWYNPGLRNVPYWSRKPDDIVAGTKVPQSSITLFDGSGIAHSFPCFDVDVWTEITDTFNPADKNYTPDLFRTIHGIQLQLELFCAETISGDATSPFVIPKSYEGLGAIPSITRATMFSFAGINSQTGTTGSLIGGGFGNIAISGFTFPYYPINVFFTVLDAAGNVTRAGPGSVPSSGVLFWDNGAFLTTDENFTCVISLGWTRAYPNEFLYMFEKQAWIPSTDGVTGNPITPPTSSNPGRWQKRTKSSQYKEADTTGIVKDTNGFRNFVTNDYARYAGDNWNDPTVHPETPTSDTHGFQFYYDKLYEGLLAPANQATLVASMSGTVTASDTMWIADSTKHWWGSSGTPLHTESGTATAGSTTDLTDTTKSGNGFWAPGINGMISFVVKVTISGVDYFRKVTAQAGGDQLFWTEALPSSASGQAYSVDWPQWENNRWKDRTLNMVYPGGATHSVNISGNDDQRLYFTALAGAPPVGTTYTIVDQFPGGVWQWNGTNWIVPTGNDMRTGSPVPWHANQTENLPVYNTNYGRFHKDDYITQKLFNEIYSACNSIIWTKQAFTWGGGWRQQLLHRNKQRKSQFRAGDSESRSRRSGLGQGRIRRQWRAGQRCSVCRHLHRLQLRLLLLHCKPPIRQRLGNHSGHDC